jgi:hypothetical protein
MALSSDNIGLASTDEGTRKELQKLAERQERAQDKEGNF